MPELSQSLANPISTESPRVYAIPKLGRTPTVCEVVKIIVGTGASDGNLWVCGSERETRNSTRVASRAVIISVICHELGIIAILLRKLRFLRSLLNDVHLQNQLTCLR